MVFGPHVRAVGRFCLILALTLLIGLAGELEAQELLGDNFGVDGDGLGLSLEIAPGNQLAVTYFNSQTGQLKYSRQAGGVWTTEIVDSNPGNINSKTTLVIFNNQAHVFYFNSSGDLLHGYQSSGGWQRETIDGGNNGGWISAIPCGLNICVSYQNQSSSNLRFARGNSGSWATHTVDSQNGVGLMSAQALLNDGRVVIVYFDEVNNNPKVATELSGTSWSVETVRLLTHQFGAYPSVRVGTDGTIHFSSSRYAGSTTQSDLAAYYAFKKPGQSWNVSVVTDDFAGEKTGIAVDNSGLAMVAHRYNRSSVSFGDESSVELSALGSSGTWDLQRLGGDISSSPGIFDFSDINMKSDFWNNPVLVSNFSRGAALGLPALNAIRVHSVRDADGDGIPDINESAYGTDINDADTDNDGYLDGVEVTVYFSNPTVFDEDLDQYDNDGDGIPNPFDSDDDNDGLSDVSEADYGTDPFNPDSDGDGVLDGDEVMFGSDPLDAGSYTEVLKTTFCSEWNGFLDGMWNIFELVNMSGDEIWTRTSLYDISGTIISTVDCTISGGAQCDVLVHDMEGRLNNSYGKVCVSHSGLKGDLDGRMVYYKGAPTGGYQFAFSMPVSNGQKGRQYVTYNTFQPSFNPSDVANVVANWIQISNLTDQSATGTLLYYDQFGALIKTQPVSLLPEARQDFAAHEVGPSLYGVIEWIPDNPEQIFQIRNVRYLYDNPIGINSFQTAFQLEAGKGSGAEMVAPLDTRSQTSIIEIVNTETSLINVAVDIYTEAGALVETFNIPVGAKASYHLIIDPILGTNLRGVAKIRGSLSGSVHAVVMQYERQANGSISSMYGVRASETLGLVLRGSYNTFLGQESELVVVNSSNVSQNANINMIRSNGSAVVLGLDAIVPANGSYILSLNSIEIPDNYGVVTLNAVDGSDLSAWVLRKRPGEYIMPVPLRQ